jgi:hypothetical protein
MFQPALRGREGNHILATQAGRKCWKFLLLEIPAEKISG